MKKIMLSIGLTFIVSSSSQAIDLSKHIKRTTLEEGPEVAVVEQLKSPIINVTVGWKVGSRDDGTLPGITNITTDALVTGTEKHTKKQLQDILETFGIIQSLDTSKTHTNISLSYISDDEMINNKRAINYLAEVLSGQRFPNEEIKKIKENNISTIKTCDTNQTCRGFREYYKEAFKNSGYSHPIEGTIESIDEITVKNIKNHYKTYYNNKNAVITFTGNIQYDKAIKIAKRIAQAMPKTSSNEQVNNTLTYTTSNKTLDSTSPQVEYIKGKAIDTGNLKEKAALIISNKILGGSSFSSRLWKSIRENNGLAYIVSSGFSPMTNNLNNFYIYLQTKNDTANKAIDKLKNTYEKYLKEGPTNDEIETERKSTIRQIESSNVTINEISTSLLHLLTNNLPSNYYQEMIKNLKEVTIEDVKNANKKHLNFDTLTTIQVGKVNA